MGGRESTRARERDFRKHACVVERIIQYHKPDGEGDIPSAQRERERKRERMRERDRQRVLIRNDTPP